MRDLFLYHGEIIDIELYYEVVPKDNHMALIFREEEKGVTTKQGKFDTMEEIQAYLVEYKSKLEKLVALEKELFE